MTGGSFGSWLRHWRITKGLTQRELAPIVGVGFPHLSKIEHDRERPSLRLLLDLAEALDVDVDAMVARSGRCVHCRSFPERDEIPVA